MRDDTVLQTDFIGPCHLDHVGGHDDYEAFRCASMLLPENAYCLNVATELS